MNWFDVLFETFGGLALFLFGMRTLSNGLKSASSEGIRNVLSHLTRNRVIALFVGCAVTMLIQSSSATTVMTVGFVNAGLMTFRQAIALVLGANIGTTFTAWIVSLIGKFKISAYALPAISVGFVMWQFVKNKRAQQIGEIVFGFGLLFFGLDIMKDAFKPLKESTYVINMFAQFSTNPILGILVGTIFTVILQSSSATIAIVQTLAYTGVISFDAAIPLILGDNIGTTITAQLAALGTNYNARRTARAHAMFNILGTAIVLPLVWVGIYGSIVEKLMPGELTHESVMMNIALAHSLFNVLNAVVFTILLDFLIKATTMLTPGEEETEKWQPKRLSENLLSDPINAMQLVINELVRMAELAKQTVLECQAGFAGGNQKDLDSALDKESTLDEFQSTITSALIRLSEQHLDTRESMEYPILLHSVNDLEKIGDYAKNIVDYAITKRDHKLTLEPTGVQEINEMFRKLYELFDRVIGALRKSDSRLAAEAVEIEDQIDDMKATVRKNHIARLHKNKSHPEGELMIMDLATNIEKMGDHLISIAKAVGKDLQWGKKTNPAVYEQVAAAINDDG